jgi:predicted Zn-dependent peptidase
MSLASRFSVTSRSDYSQINIECLSSNLEPTLKTLSKIILDPLFSGLRIDAVKKFMQHQGKIEQDDSVVVGHLANLEAFWRETGYAGSIYGDEKSLEAIKSKDIKEFYSTYFTASNIVVSASSDLPEEVVLKMIEKCFAPIRRGQLIPLSPLGVVSVGEKKKSVERDTKQSFISLAFPLAKMTPRTYALFYLIENLLGKGPGSRLWSLRAEEKLAYNVNCHVTQMQEGGILEAYLETEPKKGDLAIGALKRTLANVFENGTTAAELQATKTMAKANFLRDNELRATRASTLATFEALGLGFSYFSDLISLIDALTLEEVNAALKDVLDPGKAFELVVGPKEEAK